MIANIITWDNVQYQPFYMNPTTYAAKQIKEIKENRDNPSTLKVAGCILGGSLLIVGSISTAGVCSALGYAFGPALFYPALIFSLFGSGIIHVGVGFYRAPKIVEEDMKKGCTHLMQLIFNHNYEIDCQLRNNRSLKGLKVDIDVRRHLHAVQ